MAEYIKLLFIGDIVGKPGLEFALTNLPDLITKYKSNLVVVNGENVCNGKGITEKEANELFDIGTHIITTGNHIWENWKARPLLAKNSNVLRPYNYPPGNTGYGYTFFKLNDAITAAVIQLQGRTYMQAIDCPFRAADNAVAKISEVTNNIIVDFHADASAEKIAMGWHLDGKVSAVIGTHTHVQTADACILPNGTAYISDVGMTGPYNSVVGLRKDIALKRFILQTAHKYEMGEGDVKIAGVFVVIDPTTHQSMKIEPFVQPDYERSIDIKYE